MMLSPSLFGAFNVVVIMVIPHQRKPIKTENNKIVLIIFLLIKFSVSWHLLVAWFLVSFYLISPIIASLVIPPISPYTGECLPHQTMYHCAKMSPIPPTPSNGSAVL